MKGNPNNAILQYWAKNLVESPSAFMFNQLVTLSAGVIYTFRIAPSGYLLFLFGVVSPIIFTLCLYGLLQSCNGEILGQPIPGIFHKKPQSQLAMIIDCLLIGLFALLIHLGYLNYFLFRFLQTIAFPLLLLTMLKGLYIGITHR